MHPVARLPVGIVDVGPVNADVHGQAEEPAEQDRREAAEERVLRLDDIDAARAQDGAADAEHAQKAVERVVGVGGDGVESRRELARFEAMLFVRIRDDDVVIEMLGVAHHALVILAALALPKAARKPE